MPCAVQYFAKEIPAKHSEFSGDSQITKAHNFLEPFDSRVALLQRKEIKRTHAQSAVRRHGAMFHLERSRTSRRQQDASVFHARLFPLSISDSSASCQELFDPVKSRTH